MEPPGECRLRWQPEQGSIGFREAVASQLDKRGRWMCCGGGWWIGT